MHDPDPDSAPRRRGPRPARSRPDSPWAVVVVLGVLVAAADLDALRDAAVTYKSRNGRFLAVGDESGARADARMGPRRYQADGASVTLGWEPRACVRRQQCVTDVGYWVESDGTSFTAHAFLDSDGDGTLAEYVATAEQHARRVTDAAVR